jgi:hypothetical protein
MRKLASGIQQPQIRADPEIILSRLITYRYLLFFSLYEAKQEVLEDLRTGTVLMDRDLVERIRTNTSQKPDPAASTALLEEISALFAAKLTAFK